jgi:hypothetical protein
VRTKPLTEVISSNVYGTISLVAWINLGMNDMRVGKKIGQESMDMSRE